MRASMLGAYAAAAPNNARASARAAPGNDVFEYARKRVASVATFSVTEKSSVAESTGSGFIVENIYRPGVSLLLTAAHVALPNFAKVNETCNPYTVTLPTNQSQVYGMTTLNEWPYRYLGDVYDDAQGRRVFVELDILGVDWHSDLAVFQILTPGTYLPLDLATAPPAVGDELYSLNNLWMSNPTNLATGTVRQENFQPNSLLSPMMTTTVDLAQGSSGAAFIRITSPAVYECVGMYISGIQSTPGITYTMGVSIETFQAALDSICIGITYTDSLLQSELGVIVAISTYELGVDADLLTVSDLDITQPLPANAGYVYNASIPYGPLQSYIKERDLILNIQPLMMPPTVLELGSYGVADGQYTMSQALATLPPPTGTPAQQVVYEITVLPWGFGGYGATRTIKGPIRLRNLCGRTWTWWFQWLIVPAGGSVADFPTEIDASTFTKTISESVARRQWQRIVDNGVEFVPLKVDSLVAVEYGGIGLLPDGQEGRIEAIVNECAEQLSAYLDASDQMDVVVGGAFSYGAAQSYSTQKIDPYAVNKYDGDPYLVAKKRGRQTGAAGPAGADAAGADDDRRQPRTVVRPARQSRRAGVGKGAARIFRSWFR